MSAQSSQSILFPWEPPSLEEQNGIIIQYHVIVMETQILYLDNGTVISQMGMNFNRTYNDSEGRTQLIDMLHPSYNYTFRIAAATVVGIGPFSDPITVMILEDGEICNRFLLTLRSNFSKPGACPQLAVGAPGLKIKYALQCNIFF